MDNSLNIIFLVLQTAIASITGVLFYQTVQKLKASQDLAEDIKKAHNINSESFEKLVARMQDIELMLAVQRKERNR